MTSSDFKKWIMNTVPESIESMYTSDDQDTLVGWAKEFSKSLLEAADEESWAKEFSKSLLEAADEES